MKNVEAPDLSIVYTFLIFRHKNASISNQVRYRKTKIYDGSLARRGNKFEGGPSQHCSAFRYFVAKRWKIWKHQISALYMLFQLLATTSRAADLTSLYGSFIFSSKKLAKKTPKMKEVYTSAHTRTQQEWVPEGTKSQLLIRIIYFLHAFCAMTPRPTCATRFRLQNW